MNCDTVTESGIWTGWSGFMTNGPSFINSGFFVNLCHGNDGTNPFYLQIVINDSATLTAVRTRWVTTNWKPWMKIELTNDSSSMCVRKVLTASGTNIKYAKIGNVTTNFHPAYISILCNIGVRPTYFEIAYSPHNNWSTGAYITTGFVPTGNDTEERKTVYYDSSTKSIYVPFVQSVDIRIMCADRDYDAVVSSTYSGTALSLSNVKIES